MAYVPTAPPILMVPHVGDGPGLWLFEGADAHTAIDADDYISNGDDIGMREGDAVLYYDNNVPGSTVHHVRTAVTAGSASLTIATIV